MFLLYRFFKQIFRFAVWNFYRRVHVKGRENLAEKGPLIVVANHPNGMLDPVLVASLYERDFFFLAMSKLFRGRLRSWLLRRLRMIPVYRPSDGCNAAQNLGMFDAVAKKLGEGEAIIVFPEGTSMGERRLYPMKTGPARIAFLAETLAEFGLDLKIQPVGVTYSDLGAFQSTVTLSIGDPIEVGRWKDAYATSPRAAVADLTRHIGQKLEELTVSLNDIEYQRLVDKIEKVYNLQDHDVHARIAQIGRAVETLAPRDPDRRSVIEARIDTYLRTATEMKLLPGQESSGFKRGLLFASLVPLIVIGALLHWLPVAVTKRLVNRPHHKSYTATRKLLIGSACVIGYYLLMGAVLLLSGLGFVWTLAALTLSGVCGVLANKCLHEARALYYSLPLRRQKSRLVRLKTMREGLISELESLRKEADSSQTA